MHLKYIIILSLLIFNNICFATYDLNNQKVSAFIDHMHNKHNYSKEYLIKILSNIEPSQKVLENIARPFEEQPWNIYQARFVDKKRITEGVEFYIQNKETLKKAEQQFNVPIEIITAIIGAETSYGKITGTYPVLQALATLAFDYPKRASFFTKELEEYLLLTKEHNLNPRELKGSYAGAMGMPQFISSSYRAYAVDFTGKGSADLINNTEDAIASVANYFKKHGWRKNEPVASIATITNQEYANNIIATDKNPKPIYKLSTFIRNGIEAKDPKINKTNTDVALLELTDNKNKKKEYWLGMNNFYVITRYNHSTNYAMAVYQLSLKIKQEIDKINKNTGAS